MYANVKPEDLITVTIKSRKETLFEGSAFSVTSQNEGGFFDILPFHTNYVTLVKDFVVLDKGLATEKNIQLDKGIVTVTSNIVRVYVGI